MRIIVIIIVVGLVGGGLAYYFLSQSPDVAQDDPVEESYQSEGDSEERKKPKTSPAIESNNFETKETSRVTDRKSPVEEKKETDPQFEPEFEEDDYAEPVEIEDFKEFVDNALEELEEDEEIAVAIIMEMGKIVKAQPKLEEEAVRFYKMCVDSGKLNDSIKSHCIGALKERGL